MKILRFRGKKRYTIQTSNDDFYYMKQALRSPSNIFHITTKRLLPLKKDLRIQKKDMYLQR